MTGGALLALLAAMTLAACSKDSINGTTDDGGTDASDAGCSCDGSGLPCSCEPDAAPDAASPDSATPPDTAPDAAVLDSATPPDGGPVGPAQSCSVPGAGRTNCGPSGAESCCTSPLVTGVTTASFSRSYDGVTTGYRDPQYKALVSDFRLDKYEITVGRFRQYVTAVEGGWRPSAGSGKHTHLPGGGLNGGSEPGWDATWNTAKNFPTTPVAWDSNLICYGGYSTWTSASGANENKPVNCIRWYDAAAFCIWDGGFLPSEAEWNYAASGGTEQRMYPWGSTVPVANTNLAIYGCYYNGTGPGSCSGVANIAPVGMVPAGNGKYGQSDLAGSVWEWTLDWYLDPYNETTCTDCSYLTSSAGRVFRGGSYSDGAEALLGGSAILLASYRQRTTPTGGGLTNGARCARSP
jgi:formylglycine-generating enzyme required for sulfatase activity